METSSRDTDTRMGGMVDTANLLATYGTLAFLAGLCLYLLSRAAEAGVHTAIRSIAAILFPPTIASFIYLFNRELLNQLGKLRTGVAFTGAATTGVLIMVVLRFVVRDFALPIAEVVTAACFSVLAFSSRTIPEKQALSYYYGVLSGLLLYIILFGFPAVR